MPHILLKHYEAKKSLRKTLGYWAPGNYQRVGTTYEHLDPPMVKALPSSIAVQMTQGIADNKGGVTRAVGGLPMSPT